MSTILDRTVREIIDACCTMKLRYACTADVQISITDNADIMLVFRLRRGTHCIISEHRITGRRGVPVSIANVFDQMLIRLRRQEEPEKRQKQCS